MEEERIVKIGIVRAESLRVVFHAPYRFGSEEYVGVHTFAVSPSECMFVPCVEGATFTLENVVIGIGFHWERSERQTFSGALLLKEEDGLLRAVNVVGAETYLNSVIGSEMCADAPLELLKAHAVISRSWLLAMMDKARGKGKSIVAACHEEKGKDSVLRWYDSESHEGFDVCADDHCQRYQGVTRQTNPRVAEAVAATRGQVLTYDGHICDARFSKCCGGVTEVFESCWENIRHPYLVAKSDPYCCQADAVLVARVLNSYDRETCDFYEWTLHYTTEELSALVARKSGYDFGRILRLEPLQRGLSGRIVTLRIVGEKRTMIVGKELEIRKWLSDSHLYSSAFDVETVADGFVLHGRGWGHGVGLCQIGAAVMGDRGIPYTEILDFYYPRAELRRMW